MNDEKSRDERVNDGGVPRITPRPPQQEDKASVNLPGDITTPNVVPVTDRGMEMNLPGDITTPNVVPVTGSGRKEK
ncbi:hypothetical protein ACI3L1_07675 [Deinococcus sp. SM5_A1]